MNSTSTSTISTISYLSPNYLRLPRSKYDEQRWQKYAQDWSVVLYHHNPEPQSWDKLISLRSTIGKWSLCTPESQPVWMPEVRFRD